MGSFRTGAVTGSILCLLAAGSAGVNAEAGSSAAAETAPPPPPCQAEEYRQFDFWLGDWDVTNRAAPQRPPAHNRITSVQNGCVILEEYDTPAGYTGVSLSFYDAAARRWHQTWMDNQGQPILHGGGLREGKMVLVDRTEGATINRTTWSPQEDGSVRQHWERSGDGGQSWTTVFDGLYTRRKPG